MARKNLSRKDTPWQADFNSADKERIVRRMIEHHASWDRWGHPLAVLEWWKGRKPARMKRVGLQPPYRAASVLTAELDVAALTMRWRPYIDCSDPASDQKVRSSSVRDFLRLCRQ